MRLLAKTPARKALKSYISQDFKSYDSVDHKNGKFHRWC